MEENRKSEHGINRKSKMENRKSGSFFLQTSPIEKAIEFGPGQNAKIGLWKPFLG